MRQRLSGFMLLPVHRRPAHEFGSVRVVGGVLNPDRSSQVGGVMTATFSSAVFRAAPATATIEL
jgi:hypothetical protein